MAGTWGYHTDEDAPEPIAFLSEHAGRIDLLENFRGIQLTPDLARALAEHAAAGGQICILTNRPIRRVEALLGHPEVEIRFVEYLEHSLLRAGDAMLLALIVDYEADQPPPLLQLHRTGHGGLFDRLLDNLDVIAANAEGPLTAPGQLDRYRTNHDDETDEDGTEPPEQDHDSAVGPSTLPVSVDDPAVPGQHEPSQRRWPRRAN
ncbi:MAG: hypothetical protein JOY89_03080 [Solirubrobacterales bacterium]|nr:hypothetical protein [Solirubrobacterales bacterium]